MVIHLNCQFQLWAPSLPLHPRDFWMPNISAGNRTVDGTILFGYIFIHSCIGCLTGYMARLTVLAVSSLRSRKLHMPFGIWRYVLWRIPLFTFVFHNHRDNFRKSVRHLRWLSILHAGRIIHISSQVYRYTRIVANYPAGGGTASAKRYSGLSQQHQEIQETPREHQESSVRPIIEILKNSSLDFAVMAGRLFAITKINAEKFHWPRSFQHSHPRRDCAYVELNMNSVRHIFRTPLQMAPHHQALPRKMDLSQEEPHDQMESERPYRLPAWKEPSLDLEESLWNCDSGG